jgi:hypothetical protein
MTRHRTIISSAGGGIGISDACSNGRDFAVWLGPMPQRISTSDEVPPAVLAGYVRRVPGASQ